MNFSGFINITAITQYMLDLLTTFGPILEMILGIFLFVILIGYLIWIFKPNH